MRIMLLIPVPLKMIRRTPWDEYVREAVLINNRMAPIVLPLI
jgi:hypothetical protein